MQQTNGIDERKLLFPLLAPWHISALLLLHGVAGFGQQSIPKADSESAAYDISPQLIYQEVEQSMHQELTPPGIEPRQTESTVVVVSVTVNLQGLPTHVFAIHGGAGLDEKAVKVVRSDRFKPALKNGKPVSATISVKVIFDPETN